LEYEIGVRLFWPEQLDPSRTSIFAR